MVCPINCSLPGGEKKDVENHYIGEVRATGRKNKAGDPGTPDPVVNRNLPM
jgi:hypothetical protein